MIQFEFLSSSDPELVGTPIFYLNQIYIGNNAAHIHIQEDVSSQFMSIEITEDSIQAFLFDKGFFLLNNKRCESHRTLHIGDIIKIGNTALKLIKAEYQIYKTKSELVNDAIQSLESNSEKKKLIDLLDQYKES